MSDWRRRGRHVHPDRAEQEGGRVPEAALTWRRLPCSTRPWWLLFARSADSGRAGEQIDNLQRVKEAGEGEERVQVGAHDLGSNVESVSKSKVRVDEGLPPLPLHI